MARHNLVFLYASVSGIKNNPVIKNDETGKPLYAILYVDVVRPDREVGDHIGFLKADRIPIFTQNEEHINYIKTLKVYDIVEIKGTVNSKTVKKSSICTNEKCKHKNVLTGALVFVHPIFIVKRAHFDTADKVRDYLAENQEISNQLFLLGTLCRDPKKICPKSGLTITQYQIALNRKFRVKEDAPEIRTDYPWVKSYGEKAKEDRKRLHIGSQVYIDGCLQNRDINKHAICEVCGEKYDWRDRALEIVPFDTEYINNFYTDEDLAEIEHNKAQSTLNSILSNGVSETYTEEEIAAGIDSINV